MLKDLIKLVFITSLTSLANASLGTNTGADDVYSDVKSLLDREKGSLVQCDPNEFRAAFRYCTPGPVSNEMFEAMRQTLVRRHERHISLLEAVLKTELSNSVELELAKEMYEFRCALQEKFKGEIEKAAPGVMERNAVHEKRYARAFSVLPDKAKFVLKREKQETFLQACVDNKDSKFNIFIFFTRYPPAKNTRHIPEIRMTATQNLKGKKKAVTIVDRITTTYYKLPSQSQGKESEEEITSTEEPVERKEQPKPQSNN